MKYILFVAFLGFSLHFSYGQTARKAIKAGKLIDVKTGKILLNQIILIDGNTVSEIAADIKIPDSTEIIDLSAYTVLPGLIDCHTHIVGQQGEDYYSDIFRKTAIDYAITAHLTARKTLEAGFTSCRDVGCQELIDISLKTAINNGSIIGPRLQVAAMPIGSTGSHIDLNGFSPYLNWYIPKEMTGIANGIDEVRKQVRYNIKYGADVIKFIAGAGVLSEEESPGAPQYSQEEMNAIVDEARRWGKKICAHAHGTEAIKMAVKAGVTSIEHGSMLDDEAIEMMKERNTYLVPTIYVGEFVLSEFPKLGYPEKIINKARIVSKAASETFTAAVRKGVRIAYGTDAAVFPHGLNARQFKLMVKAGMTPLQALQSATINAADLLGWSDKIGSLASGKFADIIAVTGNPLDDISILESVQFVMKDGHVIKSSR